MMDEANLNEDEIKEIVTDDLNALLDDPDFELRIPALMPYAWNLFGTLFHEAIEMHHTVLGLLESVLRKFEPISGEHCAYVMRELAYFIEGSYETMSSEVLRMIFKIARILFNHVKGYVVIGHNFVFYLLRCIVDNNITSHPDALVRRDALDAIKYMLEVDDKDNTFHGFAFLILSVHILGSDNLEARVCSTGRVEDILPTPVEEPKAPEVSKGLQHLHLILPQRAIPAPLDESSTNQVLAPKVSKGLHLILPRQAKTPDKLDEIMKKILAMFEASKRIEILYNKYSGAKADLNSFVRSLELIRKCWMFGRISHEDAYRMLRDRFAVRVLVFFELMRLSAERLDVEELRIGCCNKGNVVDRAGAIIMSNNYEMVALVTKDGVLRFPQGDVLGNMAPIDVAIASARDQTGLSIDNVIDPKVYVDVKAENTCTRFFIVVEPINPEAPAADDDDDNGGDPDNGGGDDDGGDDNDGGDDDNADNVILGWSYIGIGGILREIPLLSTDLNYVNNALRVAILELLGMRAYGSILHV